MVTLPAQENATGEALGHYQVGESIGKGGFGVVYRALDMESGATVAVKRMNLRHLPRAELQAIESEITLLRDLDHTNIVKYVETVRTKEHLHIVMEYVENGALSGVIANFGGKLPESLVALYIAQVLLGLDYLHSQGVIHRDIKCANILATKEGRIKLADFGVATTLAESQKSDSVVGSPYWMAPEIIEMSGQMSTACDIWSVGCSTIEMISGAPPYFDLAPMPALFRIVQDDHPPIPAGVSPAGKDFLMQCFQKDPNLRITAASLLRHPWLKAPRRNFTRAENMISHVKEADPTRQRAAEVLQSTIRWNAATLESMTSRFSALELQQQQPGETSTMRFHGTPDTQRFSTQQISASGRDEKEDTLDSWADSDDDGGFFDNDTTVKVAPAELSKAMREMDTLSDFDDGDDDDFEDGLMDHLGRQRDMTSSGMSKWRDQEDDEDAFGFDENDDQATVRLDTTKLHRKMAWDQEVDEVFNNDDFDERDTKADEQQRKADELQGIIKWLTTKESEEKVLEACDSIREFLNTEPELTVQQMLKHGLVSIMELLESKSETILSTTLQLLRDMMDADTVLLESLCRIGLIPAMYNLIRRPDLRKELRERTARFFLSFATPDSHSNNFLQDMFVACGGLSYVIALFRGPLAANTEVVFTGVQCVETLLKISGHTKTDFCRLFAKFGLIDVILDAFLQIHNLRELADSDAETYAMRLAHLLTVMSQSHALVRINMAQSAYLSPLVKLIPHLPHDLISAMCKVLRQLALDAAAGEELYKCDIIPTLIPLLKSDCEIESNVLHVLFSLCRVAPEGQDVAVKSGIIPHLIRFIREHHPQMPVACPFLLRLVHVNSARSELRKVQGIQVFIDTLSAPSFCSEAMGALSHWMQHDTRRVEAYLLQKHNLTAFIEAVRSGGGAGVYGGDKAPGSALVDTGFGSIVAALESMTRASLKLMTALGKSDIFADAVDEQLNLLREATQLNSLLKLLQGFLKAQPVLWCGLIRRLLPTLQRMSKDKSRVMVKGVANSILAEYDTARRITAGEITSS